MNRTPALLLLALPLGAPAQDGVAVTVERLMRSSSHHEALLRVTNKTGNSFKAIGLRCTFFNGRGAVDTGANVAVNVKRGDTVFEKVIGPYTSTPVTSVQCGVSYANK